MARVLQVMLLAVIHAYRRVISPLVAMAGVRCRHEPSCSLYALEAVRRHGAWFGAWMALARVQRCRPGGTSGYDPTPATDSVAASVPWWRPWIVANWRGPDQPLSTESVETQHHAHADLSRRR